MASIVFRPDADPETSSVDGWVRNRTTSSDGDTWANVRAGTGDAGLDAYDTQESDFASIFSAEPSGKWREIERSIIVFDTSDLPDDIPIISATLSLYGGGKGDYLSISPTINVFSANPASDTALETADYTDLGGTPYSSSISYASWDTSGWNNFALNATGIAAISKTGASKFGIREAKYDATGLEPAWSYPDGFYKWSSFWWRSADYSDGSLAPKLTITYTTSTMEAGNFAVVETRLHYVGTDSVERYIAGAIIGDGVNAAGNIAVVEERLQYIGATSNKERYWLGTEIGASSQAVGNIAVVESRFHYTDTSSKERYIKGIPV